MHHGAVGNDAYVCTLAHHASFTERNCEISAGVLRAIVRLAIEMLVLEEQHRIIGANGSAEQTAHVQSRGRHYHSQPGDMREGDFSTLAVINRAAGQVAANGDAHDDWSLEMPRGTPAEDCDLVAQLHHGRPDVV